MSMQPSYGVPHGNRCILSMALGMLLAEDKRKMLDEFF